MTADQDDGPRSFSGPNFGPETALEYLVELRSSVIVPIPGLLAEKYLGPEQAAALARPRRPPSATPLCFSAASSSAGDRGQWQGAARSEAEGSGLILVSR